MCDILKQSQQGRSQIIHQPCSITPAPNIQNSVGSYLTVASSEALAAGARVLPIIHWSAGRGECQAEPPVEAGLAFAGVWTRYGPGGSGLGWCRGVRGQLEGIGNGFSTVTQKQEEEK